MSTTPQEARRDKSAHLLNKKHSCLIRDPLLTLPVRLKHPKAQRRRGVRAATKRDGFAALRFSLLRVVCQLSFCSYTVGWRGRTADRHALVTNTAPRKELFLLLGFSLLQL